MKIRFIIFCILSFGVNVYSQEDTLSSEFEEIIIQDKRIEIQYSESSRTINVIDNKTIGSAPVQSIAELLQYVAGIDVRRRGVNGVQSDVSIRGGGFDQTQLMVNGINLSDPQTGHHLMNIPLNIEDIERIEILKGPGARVYGQNAFSGAINIVTKKNRGNSTDVFTSYSQHVTGRVGFSSSIPVTNGSHRFSYSKSFSEGYRYNTDYNMDNVFYQSDFKWDNDQLQLIAGYSSRAFGANGFYASPNARDQYEETGTSLLSARLVHRSGSWTIRPSLYWRRNQDEYIFVRSNPSIYRNLHIGNTFYQHYFCMIFIKDYI